ncbi:TolC family outer membrane protein [Massilia sp. S19_KUP03_FR1]|uniref:TolC family outer membrane protein n=1 Tax=Massilia sp. S19_KUP03_FR1 TaxID=3025503 RepID=UPI002FCD89A4
MQKSLIAALLAGAFFSPGAVAADLIQVYQQALANDAVYASARASEVAGKERIPQGKSALYPSIAGTAAITRNMGDLASAQVIPNADGTTTTVINNTNNTSKQYAISLTQPLFRWDRWQTYQQSKLQEAISEAQFAQAQQDLITRVAQAYFDVLAAQDTLESTRSQKSAVTEQLASAKRNFEVGTQTITDTHEAQAAYDLVIAQEFAASADLENKRSALLAIVGGDAVVLAPLRPGVTLASPSPATIEPWLSAAQSQNYGVTVSELSLESAKRDIERNRAGHLPTLDLIASNGRTLRNGDVSNTSRGTSNAIGVQLNVPIFSGFAVTSRVRESIALEDKARNDLESTRRNAVLGVRQAYLGVNSGLAQVKALEAAEISSQSALDSNKLGYQVGVRINIDVLNAQRQLFSTQTDLSKARYSTIMSGLRLKAAAGSLREADLVPVNALLVR